LLGVVGAFGRVWRARAPPPVEWNRSTKKILHYSKEQKQTALGG